MLLFLRTKKVKLSMVFDFPKVMELVNEKEVLFRSLDFEGGLFCFSNLWRIFLYSPPKFYEVHSQ